MNIVTKGLGNNQKLITQGYGYVVSVTGDSGNEYQFGGVRLVSKNDFNFFKQYLEDIIETEKILTKKDSVSLDVKITYLGSKPNVTAILEELSFAPHHVTITVTN